MNAQSKNYAIWIIAASVSLIAAVALCGAVAIGATYLNIRQTAVEQKAVIDEQHRVAAWNEDVLEKVNKMESDGATTEQLKAFDEQHFNKPPKSFRAPSATR